MSVLVADDEQAKKIEANFRENAEDTYQKIVALLSEEPGKEQ